jgi:CheY-like chemotaxis protein
VNFNGKILLVDDESHIRKFVGLILKKLGTPTIIEAANGQDALRLFPIEQPDLVLLDVNMPVIDGLQALAELMKINPDVTVVMLTSLINRQTVEECLRLGAAGYIRKDTPSAEIYAQLECILNECFGPEADLPTP